jgi:hypothetical protein
MPRPYGEKLLRILEAADGSKLGQKLGRACMEANIPMSYAAEALEVTRLTIDGWFKGKSEIRINTRPRVEAFIALIQDDLQKGRLPAQSISDARAYISDVMG